MEYHSGGSLPLLGRPRYCPGASANGGYLCETGHCCGETGCCTYYYELWWFWLLWTVLILFSCCCAYRHRRAKLRVQQQQRQREISLLAYHGANSYPSSMLDLSFLASLKLPSYEEVAAQPSTPPPPYSSVFTTPRYPQPPRAADPHLLTQHDPLLHRPLSDGPSSLSSDNSSSCSCDSCCPSSPCSSSLSAPITYETDTSHASTPSEATPLTLDVTMETIAAATSCLEVNETRLSPDRLVPRGAVCDTDAARPQEPVATESSVPNQTVTVALVTRAASPLSSPGTNVAAGTTSPIMQQCAPAVSTCSLCNQPSPNVADVPLPSIQIITTDECPQMNPGPSGPTVNTCDGPTTTRTPEPLTRTFNAATVLSGPVSVPATGGGGSLATMTGSTSPTACDPNSSLLLKPASSDLSQSPISSDAVPTDLIQVTEPVSTNLFPLPGPVPTSLTCTSRAESTIITHVLGEVPTNLSQGLEPEPEPTKVTSVPQAQYKTTSVHHFTLDSILNLKPTRATDAAAASCEPLVCQNTEPSSGSAVVLVPPSPESAAVGPVVFDLDPSAQAFHRPGSGSAPPSSPSSFCPAINIESEASLAPVQTPSPALSPTPPPRLPSPSASLPAPSLLLDPLTALHQSDKGGSSGHASSLSPSPRATQSPPKQTLFSPCVDVFEPGPPNWKDGEEDHEEEGNEDEDEDDVAADESQYRHRRLTGDSGIEVCRCRVDEEDEEEEDDEEKGERMKEGRRGGGGEKDDPDLHDSVDCPARGQIITGEGLTLCNQPPTSSTAPTSEDSGKVVIVMETV
ncbi:uncharacterized protein LOC114851241 [Betta splendens]|uniref:Uncharacterized protein LOC114851241 n=1 Tax=Betta splendens TaxID=158456 RepID=A0A6P7LXZ2_BETSP|nr:uncharacterized protein LOC114851241 [Betta splendens]